MRVVVSSTSSSVCCAGSRPRDVLGRSNDGTPHAGARLIGPALNYFAGGSQTDHEAGGHFAALIVPLSGFTPDSSNVDTHTAWQRSIRPSNRIVRKTLSSARGSASS